MSFNSYEEIMDHLNSCVLEEREISKKISYIGFSLFDAEKKELRKKLKELKVEFKYYDKFIREATKFDTDLLVPFLVEYLSKNTDSRFLVCKAEKSESCERTSTYSRHIFICSAVDVMRLQIYDIDVDKRIGFDMIKDNLEKRYIRLNEAYDYELMGCDGLYGNFESFPELLEVGKKLVDLKIAYPMMSDEERLAKVLGNTMTNCRLNWKVKSFNKKIPNGKRITDMSMSEIFSSKR